MRDLKEFRDLLGVFIICASMISGTLLVYQQIQELYVDIPALFNAHDIVHQNEYDDLKTYIILLVIIIAMALLSFMLLFVQNRNNMARSQGQVSLLTEAINKADNAVLILDSHKAYFYTNDSAKKLLGDNMLSAFEDHDAKLIFDQINVSQKEDIPVSIEEELELKNGVKKSLEISIAPFLNYTQKMVIIMIRDVTVRYESDNEIQLLKHQFYQAQKMEALGRMAGGMAHDFNNILAAIMGNAEFLMDDLSEESNQHKYASKIMKAGIEARDVIAQILTYSRKQDVEVVQFNLKDVLVDIQSILEGVLKSGQSLILGDISEQYTVFGNASQMKQIIINLCSNASDAISQEYGEVAIDVQPFDFNHSLYTFLSRQNVNEPQVVNTQTFEIGHHRAFFGVINPEAHYVDLTISDDGSGMSRDVVEHIFEPFFTTKGVHEGTGLGLSAAQGVILNHKGVMVVDTIEGQGTSFHILLPYDQSDMPIASDTQSASRTDSCQANLFVVIDDQENVLDVASTMLSRLGYETKSFSNGRDALSFIKGNSDDICGVLTDENMPSMLGSDLAKSLLDVNPLIPVFIMTGFAKTLSPKRRSNLPNVKDIIQKPLVKATLKTMLSKKL